MAELYPYPRFSTAERDRRWKAVRALMRAQNLDVIVTPQNSGHSADYQRTWINCFERIVFPCLRERI